MSARSNGAVLFLRRAYTVAVENVKAQPAASVMRKVVEPSTGIIDVGKVPANQEAEREVFWMKDPKTGNWMPENHFDEVDAAELRERFLSKAPKS